MTSIIEDRGREKTGEVSKMCPHCGFYQKHEIYEHKKKFKAYVYVEVVYVCMACGASVVTAPKAYKIES
jgi:DNA-directed RNA polymerase subunit RPC12/RpoP